MASSRSSRSRADSEVSPTAAAFRNGGCGSARRQARFRGTTRRGVRRRKARARRRRRAAWRRGRRDCCRAAMATGTGRPRYSCQRDGRTRADAHRAAGAPAEHVLEARRRPARTAADAPSTRRGRRRASCDGGRASWPATRGRQRVDERTQALRSRRRGCRERPRLPPSFRPLARPATATAEAAAGHAQTPNSASAFCSQVRCVSSRLITY